MSHRRLRAVATFTAPIAAVVALALAPAPSPLAPGSARADEGQWMPEQIAGLDHQALARRGLELGPAAIWDPASGGGLMRAAVNLNGCSASFISPEGLVITNHHCAYGALQALSTVDRDLLKDGFVARTRAEELAAPGRRVSVVERIDDVTARVREVADGAADDRARALAVQKVTRELVAECDAEAPGRRCEVASFFGGSQYRRFAFLELEDVRLVYAPPSAIGEYGGEVDNWMWPRHTGDFTILRAYAGPDQKPRPRADDNVPYRPDTWLKIAAEGASPGDLVMILGYPGRTTRYLPFGELERMLDQGLPARISLSDEWISILEALGAADPAVAIKVAATKKSLANRLKNARGMLEGVRTLGLLERRRAEEERLLEWARRPENEGREAVLKALADESAASRRRAPATTALGDFAYAPTIVDGVVSLVRWARERPKPDHERANGYTERDRDKVWESIERRLRDHDEEVATQLLAAALARAAAVPADALPPVLRDMVGGTKGDRAAFAPTTRRLLRGSRMIDADALRPLFDAADADALRAHRDPLIAAANRLVDAIEANEAEGERLRGRMLVLEPEYFKMLEQVRSGPLYPDANGTLRLSVATIKGYRPRDGLEALPQTTLGGQLAKLTGAAPFDLPARVIERAAAAASTYWADPIAGDLVLCQLSDADTTGGNSGSPAVNGRGELIGLNFDRVWENIAGDVAYSPERSRNIIVDVRYLLWLLDRVEDASELLRELELDALRGRPRRDGPKAMSQGTGSVSAKVTEITEVTEATEADGAGAPPGAAIHASAAAGCSCRAEEPRLPALALLLGALALGRRRRR
ncbi:MAG: S46 family peptidase [Nannocystaceae bacterium]